ncbi:MAG: flavodoxin domain-containing protein [Candidatus Jordarchaeum sp.]|uniref:flavodoxin domain-containing protein n=1 Tax=Candidatus Jordarchaeum sp. TaxID=2823881 RepID=UPI00404B7704
MDKKVLIAYGSRYGSTEEISQEIAKVLEKQGMQVQVVDLKKTKSKDWPSLESFDGVLVASGIRIMKWMNEPQEFLKKHRGEFQKKEKKLGLFISSGFASIPENREKAKNDWIEKVMNKIGVKADIYDAFGGVYDFSESSRMGGLDKRMLKMASKGMSKEFGIEIDEKGRNDFRDWDQIRSFAEKFAELMKS